MVKNLIESVAVPIIAVCADLTVYAVNDLGRQAFPGITKQGGFADFLKRVDGLQAELEYAIATGKCTESKVKQNAGYRADYAVTIKPVVDAGKQDLPAVLMTFEDRSLFNDLKTMRIGFVANVSHEIRSPLTAISGFVETLQGPAIEDVTLRARFLDLMGKEVTRMSNLVSDLLSLSQVEAKERRVLKHSVDLVSVVDQAMTSIESVSEKWGKTVTTEIADDIPMVLGRQDDLVRVLINLLENAIHYSQTKGRVHLCACLTQGDNPLGEKAIAIAVSDDGDGIAPEEIPYLTQRFYRVDKSRSRNMGGTGLGLAIVKHILVRHGGELLIESTVGQGATFTIFLPIPRE